MRLMIVAALAMALAGCKEEAMGGGERFAAGKWEIEAWMESEQGSTRGVEGATLSDTMTLTAEQAQAPPATVFFSHFYHGAHSPAVRFADGRIEGSFRQPEVAPIAAHDVPISGTYSRDRFRVTFGYQAFGMGVDQVVEGKLIHFAP